MKKMQKVQTINDKLNIFIGNEGLKELASIKETDLFCQFFSLY